MSRTYEYGKLSPGKTIRVLHLQPSLDLNSPIHYIFEEVNLGAPKDEIREWEALSYAWGSTNPTREILCDGRSVLVTENCYAALRRLRRHNHARTLWVDAVCIDQNCVEERNHPVKIMGEVYKNARQVLIWLGEEERFAPRYAFSVG